MTIKLQDIYGLANVDLSSRTWKTIAADTAAAAGDAFLVDTTAAPVTVTLPAAPVLGDEIWFEDVAGNFGTNKLTVAQGGNPIMGLAEDMDVEMNNAMFGLVFADAAKGWRII